MITNDMESWKRTDKSTKLKGGVVMGKLFFVFALCLVLTTYAGAYDVINIDLGDGDDPVYSGNGPVSENYGGKIVIDEWNGYYNVEGDLIASPRCDIGGPGTPGTYARSVFVADDPCNAHGYVSYTTGGQLLTDGFLKTGAPTDPNPGIYLYGNWAHGGIFDVYVLSNAAGTFTIRDGKGTVTTKTVSGGGTESSWVSGLNYAKFTNVWIGGTDTRDANGPKADYLANDEYVTDPNVAIIRYSNKISGIQLASVKLRVRSAGPSDPCVCYWDNAGAQRLKITLGQWKADTPVAPPKSTLGSGRRLFFAGDYDAAYETNARAAEHDYDGPDAGWALIPSTSSPEPLVLYVDQDWANDGYLSYVDTGEWMEYDVYVTTTTKGQYEVRALVNCWWAAAEIGIYVDDSQELGVLTYPRYTGENGAVPEITDANTIVWCENSIFVNFFTGFHKFKWKQNTSYYNILAFELSYEQEIQVNNCSDVYKYGLELEGDANTDCYVDIEDLKVIVEDWANCNNPEDENCTVEEP